MWGDIQWEEEQEFGRDGWTYERGCMERDAKMERDQEWAEMERIERAAAAEKGLTVEELRSLYAEQRAAWLARTAAAEERCHQELYADDDIPF